MTRVCRCHSDDGLYGTLDACPACGHRSLDATPTWQGCERRACGYEHLGPVERPAQATLFD